jgi:hypothetical protein
MAYGLRYLEILSSTAGFFEALTFRPLIFRLEAYGMSPIEVNERNSHRSRLSAINFMSLVPDTRVHFTAKHIVLAREVYSGSKRPPDRYMRRRRRPTRSTAAFSP